MIICGIDPGTARLGYAFVELNLGSIKTETKILDCGVISTSKYHSDSARLHEMRTDLHALLKQYQPDYLSIEKIFFFKNPKTLVPVAQARGVVLELAESLKIRIFEYTPLEAKKIITGHGLAKKNLVAQIIKTEFQELNQITQDDALDAIALALCLIRSQQALLRAQ